MDYPTFLHTVFGQPEDSDPVTLDLPADFDAIPPPQALAFITRALADETVHARYSRKQIGIGLSLLFENSCGNTVFCYLQDTTEDERVAGVRALRDLYRHFFARYCRDPVDGIGNRCDERIDYLCYMFWDTFVLYPGNAPTRVIDAAIAVMAEALRSDCEAVQVSALHGLGHWAMYRPDAKEVVARFLKEALKGMNPVIRAYAEAAGRGRCAVEGVRHLPLR